MAISSLLARVRPYVQVGFSLSVVAVVLNVALSGLASTPVLGWLPRTVAGTGYLEDSRSRVAEALREYHATPAASTARLGAFVGISNVREGVELSTVTRAAGSDWHFIGLAGAGLGIGDVARFADVLSSSELRPDFVAIGISLHQLVDRRPKAGTLNVGFFEYLQRGDLRNVAIIMRDSVWAYSRRQDVNVTVQAALLDGRAEMLQRFDVEVDAAEAQQRSPWREMIKSDWPAHFSAATLREEEEFFEGFGAFELATYQQAPNATAMFIDMIEHFRAKRARVVIIVMPEHSTLRRRIPAEAFAVLQHDVRSVPSGGLEILDFRDSIGDEGFVDLAHLNRSGSAEFSALLAGRIHDVLPTGTPLMAQSAGTNGAGNQAPGTR